MARIGNVPGIIEVKNRFAELQQRGLVRDWALPYENLLTRLDAATFFFAPVEEREIEQIWTTLGQTAGLKYQQNVDKKLSDLPWQVQFDAAANNAAASAPS